MTVQDTTNKFNAVGDGSTTIFPWSNIKIINTSDMTVTVDGVLQAEGVDYTVSYDANTTNGSITFFVAPANTSAILGVRAMPLEQPFDIPIDSDFDAEKIETMNDNSVLIIQDQQDKINRSLKAPASFTGDFVSEIVAQDSVVVGNDTGTGFKDSGVDVSTLNQSVADAAASAAAALVSETNAAASAVQTANDVIQTNADVVTTNANVALTNADVITTNANVALTNADVISTNADAAAAAQSALDAQVAKIEWQGVYNGATAYELNDAVEYNGSSYINIQAGAGNLPTDVAYWDLMASKGDAGSGNFNSFTAGTGLTGSGGATVTDGDTLSIANGGVGTTQLASNSVTAAKIAANAVGSSELASTGVSAGTYNSVTVDTDGRVTAGTSGGSVNNQQLCKAWVNFEGIGTVNILDSYNVSSITDSGVGNYRINHTIAMSNINYSVNVAPFGVDSNTGIQPGGLTTGYHNIRAFNSSVSAGLDINACTSIFGDRTDD